MAPYNLENDPYIDQTTGVFRNKLGIKNVDELKEVEADIAATRIALITQQVTYEDTVLSKESLLNLHRVLFGELYDWAGQIRTVEIAKGETRFAHTDFISSELDRIFDELAAENYLKSYGEAQFFARLAYFYSELNIVHPFREGNGRTIRTFLSLLALQNDWRIAWKNLDTNENVLACQAAYHGDEAPLARMLEKLAVKL